MIGIGMKRFGMRMSVCLLVAFEADIRALVGDDARVKFIKPGETKKF